MLRSTFHRILPESQQISDNCWKRSHFAGASRNFEVLCTRRGENGSKFLWNCVRVFVLVCFNLPISIPLAGGTASCAAAWATGCPTGCTSVPFSTPFGRPGAGEVTRFFSGRTCSFCEARFQRSTQKKKKRSEKEKISRPNPGRRKNSRRLYRFPCSQKQCPLQESSGECPLDCIAWKTKIVRLFLFFRSFQFQAHLFCPCSVMTFV